MIKKYWICLLFPVALGFFIVRKHQHAIRNHTVSLKPIRSGAGWGYEIYTGGTLFIRQENIPAIAGNKAFISEKEAMVTARLVIKKMHGRDLPFLSVHELDSLHITR